MTEYSARGVLSKDQRSSYAAILDDVLQRSPVPAGGGAMVLGSIGEGLGNSKSDIDIYLIPTGAAGEYRSWRELIYIRGRRVEAFVRSTGDLRALAEKVGASGAAVSDDEIHEYQQVACGAVLRATPELATVRSSFLPETAGVIVAEMALAKARTFAWRAGVLDALGCSDRASRHARLAVRHAAKTWAARHGESYTKAKFLELQLRRAGADEGLLQALLQVDVPVSESTYVDRCRQVAGDFGLEPSAWTCSDLKGFPAAEVEPHEINGRGYLLEHGQRLYRLSAEMWAAWQIAERRAALLAGPRALPAAVKTGLLALHSAGLIGLQGSDAGGELWLKGVSPARLDIDRALVTIDLPDAPMEDAPELELIPIPAQQFVGARLDASWQQVMLDNTWEDFDGAIAAGQLSVAQHALRSQAIVLGKIHLLSEGVWPLEDEEVVLEVLHHQRISAEFKAPLAALEFVRVTSDREADQARQLAVSIYEALPERLKARSHRGSHESESIQRRAMNADIAWLPLLHRVGARTSLEAAETTADRVEELST